MAKKIFIKDIEIKIVPIKQEDYVSLTDMARSFGNPSDQIKNWLRTNQTIEFLGAWERVNNPNFKRVEFDPFKIQYLSNTFVPTIKAWVTQTAAIGIYSEKGRYGGTYAHSDIALHFALWLSPEFNVYLLKEFQRLKAEEYENRGLEWHIRKITDNIEEVRNLLDTIPGQDEERNRLGKQ